MWFSKTEGTEAVLTLLLFGLALVGAYRIRPWYKRLMGDTTVPDLLSALKPEYRVFHGIDLAGRMDPVHIDHLILSPYGIFVIKTMSYGGVIKGDDADKYWSDTVRVDTRVLENPVRINRRDADEMARLLGCRRDQIIPMVVFSNAAVLKGHYEHTVINLTHMLGTIRKYKEVRLSEEEICRCLPILEKLNGRAEPGDPGK